MEGEDGTPVRQRLLDMQEEHADLCKKVTSIGAAV